MEPRTPNREPSIPSTDWDSCDLYVMWLGLVLLGTGAYWIHSVYSSITCSILCIIGSVIALLSFMRWFGEGIGHVGLLKIQVCCLIFFFLLNAAILCCFYYIPSQTEDILSQLWDFFFNYDSRFILDIENLFSCCGYNSIEDRSVPAHCIVSGVSCQTRVRQGNFIYPLLGLVIYQCVDLVLSTVRLRALHKKMNEEERLFSCFYSHPSSESTNSGYFGRSRKASFSPRYGTTPSTRSVYYQ